MPTSRVFFEVSKLMNLTTEISMLSKAQQETRPEAIEFDTDHMAFEVDERSCRKGQLVSVDGFVQLYEERLIFTATGKITEAVALGNRRLKVTIEIHSGDKVTWKKFVLLMRQRQGQVDKIFSAIKDEE